VNAAKFSLKNPGKWQFMEQKALDGGGYAGQRLRSVVIIYQPKQHNIMATTITITCWSAVCLVGTVSLL